MDGQDLADRLRALLAREPVTEKRMFGGLCLLHHGNMLCGVMKSGEMMARVGKALEPTGRSLPGARTMDFTGRPMPGMLYVGLDALEDDATLQAWVDLCLEHARSLPPKPLKDPADPPKPKRPSRPRKDPA